MELENWTNAWAPGQLLRAESNEFPATALKFLSTYGFPRRMIFAGTTPRSESNSFEISFEPLSRKLVAFNKTFTWGDFYSKELDQRWSEQLVIGEQESCNVHASHCIHRLNGTVTRIDVELSEPETFINSGIPHYAECLLLATKWSVGNTKEPHADWRNSLEELATAIRQADPEVFTSPQKSFWPMIIDMIRDLEPQSFEITGDPRRSRPRF